MPYVDVAWSVVNIQLGDKLHSIAFRHFLGRGQLLNIHPCGSDCKLAALGTYGWFRRVAQN
jgi:hypothetical protein